MFRVPLASLAGLSGALASCGDYYASSDSTAAKQWCTEGNYFDYASERNGVTSKVFYRCSGEPSNPALILGHGWPTSSFDFQPLAALLDDDHYVCAVDYVGHGFSDKPADSTYSYSMFEHAEVVEKLVTEVLGLKAFSYVGHDEGDSVALIFLSRYEQEKKPYELEHLVLLNGGIYLPLQDIKASQQRLLSNVTGPVTERLITGTAFAAGLGSSMYSPALTKEEKSELASVFDYQSGCHVLHGTIQYLNERWEFEDEWLAMLGQSSVPTAMIWGDADTAAVPAEAQYVWDNYLANRTSAPTEFHWVSGGNHYLHFDHAEDVAGLVRSFISPEAQLLV